MNINLFSSLISESNNFCNFYDLLHTYKTIPISIIQNTAIAIKIILYLKNKLGTKFPIVSAS